MPDEKKYMYTDQAFYFFKSSISPKAVKFDNQSIMGGQRIYLLRSRNAFQPC